MNDDLIKVDYGTIGKIATEHNVTRQLVGRALRGVHTIKYDLIRAVALERGGVPYVKKSIEIKK